MGKPLCGFPSLIVWKKLYFTFLSLSFVPANIRNLFRMRFICIASNVRADLWSSKSELVRDLRILQIRLLCEVREAAAQEADVIRANVVAKGAERISPQHPNIRKFCESANFLINFDYMLYIQCFLRKFCFVFRIEMVRIYCALFLWSTQNAQFKI